MNLELKRILFDFPNVNYIGKENVILNNIKQISDKLIDENSIYWCSDKNIEKISLPKVGTLILSNYSYEFLKYNEKLLSNNFIIVDNPRRFFMELLNKYFDEKPLFNVISNSSLIHESVKFNKEKVNIGNNVVIEEGCEIGENVIVNSNTCILKNTKIGNNVKIGCNNTIGGVGFGFEKDENGNYNQIPHIGNVVIENNVEIGNNTCIDRAVLGSTLIGENVKIDNLVHIAHGVQIGCNSLIIAKAMIAGSAVIGKNVWVAPSSSIMQKISIGDDVVIGMGAVVIKDVEKGAVVAGVPAKKIN